MELIYSGFGPRQTPPLELALMTSFARLMAGRGWTLRSGGAHGADSAFMSGCLLSAPRYELYLAFAGQSNQAPATLDAPSELAMEIASRYHPRWAALDRVTKKLLGRNVHVALGRDCRTPPSFAITWTDDGALDGRLGAGYSRGGTQHTLRVLAGELEAADAAAGAKATEIINLGRPDHWNRIVEFVNDPRFRRRDVNQQERLL